MNKAPLFFLGLFFTIALSWIGVVLSNQIAYGHLEPYRDPADEQLYPQGTPGLAQRGKVVYEDLGCIYCHTQQIRRPGFGGDTERGWGDRGSVARDYIRQDRVLLGSVRIGPDLANVGSRLSDINWHYKHFYDPLLIAKGSAMPAYRFLFEERPIIGQPSSKALDIPGAGREGYEIVPTPRGEALVAYMLSLKADYVYPEARAHSVSKEGEAKETKK